MKASKNKPKNAWILRQSKDPFVKQAKSLGYRSRASLKLVEMHEKFQLFKPKELVVDLGAAPGGWSQVLTGLLGKSGLVIACDLLDMEPIEGVEFYQNDFLDTKFAEQLDKIVQSKITDGVKLGWVISDMAPNMSGIEVQDQARSMYLAESAREFAYLNLPQGGNFLVKLFQGRGFAEFVAETRSKFNMVKLFKPQSSRAESKEQYLLAFGYSDKF